MSKHHYIPTLKKKETSSRGDLPRVRARAKLLKPASDVPETYGEGEEDGTGTIFVRGRT